MLIQFYAAPFSLNFEFKNTGNTDILDSAITANIAIIPLNTNSPQNWQILSYSNNTPRCFLIR